MRLDDTDLDAIADRVAERLRPMVAEVVRADRERADVDRLLDVAALASLLGCTPAAMRARLRRGSEWKTIERVVDGRRVFSRRDVDGLIARGVK